MTFATRAYKKKEKKETSEIKSFSNKENEYCFVYCYFAGKKL